jgi:hypothetical protein
MKRFILFLVTTMIMAIQIIFQPVELWAMKNWNRKARREMWRRHTAGIGDLIRSISWLFNFRVKPIGRLLFMSPLAIMGVLDVKTALFAQKQPGGVLAIEDMSRTTGDRWFVDSGSATGADAVGYGKSPDKPFITLDYAIGSATANNGDIIYVMPGHAETYTTTGTKVTFDQAGLTIICLGEGADRPTFTFSHVDATMVMSAASVVFKNFLFVTGVDSVVTFMTISGADCNIEGEVRDTTNVEVIDAFTVTGHRFKANIIHRGYTGGNANNSTIALNSVEGADIYVEAYGKAGVGVVDMRGAASSDVVVNGIFLVTSTTNFSKTVVDTITGSTWKVTGFDIGAGARFVGGSGTAKHSIDTLTATALGADSITAAVIQDGAIDAATFAANAIAAAGIAGDAITNAKIADNALAAEQFAADAITNAKIADAALGAENMAISVGEKTCDGIVVTRAAAALPQATAAAIFTVTGHILMKRIVGVVTVTIGNIPNATKIKGNSTGAGATTDLCATLDIDNAAATARLEITGTFGNAMVKTTDVPLAKVQAAEIVIPPGTIDLDCAGSDGGSGRVRWSITYVPLESGAGVVAA